MGSQLYETVDLTSDTERSVAGSPAPQRSSAVETAPRREPSPFAKPWWHRLPYFVPVAAIDFDTDTDLGTDPRSGETVYVDYVNQFSSRDAKTAPPKPSEKPRERLSKDTTIRQSDRVSGVSECGEWTTNARGKEVFRTQDGKEYVGMKAYKMHAKLLLQQTERLRTASLNP